MGDVMLSGSLLGLAMASHVVVISIDGFAAFSWQDENVAVPHLRQLAAQGAAAAGMTPVNPTVTWPNHTSMVTGLTPARHSVLYNGQAQRQGIGKPLRVEPWVRKEELVAGKTLYDLAHAAGMTTAEVDWVAIHQPGTITWAFPEVPSVEGVIEREMMARGLVTKAQVEGFRKLPITLRDEIWTRAGEHLIERHQPRLLLFHLLTTDSAQHTYGARSLGGNTALELADTRVGRLVAALKRAGIYEQTAIFIVSDHGFKTVRRQIQPNAVLAAKGLGEMAWSIPEGGTAMVYVTGEGDKAETVRRIQAALAGVEGIARILMPGEFAEYGYPSLEANPRMADLVLAAADGYAFNAVAKGEAVVAVPAGATPGTHGYLNTDEDMRAIFIAAGKGIRKGVKLGVVRNLDLAPTAARLLGLEMKDVEGRVLEEILE
jgi:predicted AlkP superfamily pyrophosphatase or phosphodiesterase